MIFNFFSVGFFKQSELNREQSTSTRKWLTCDGLYSGKNRVWATHMGCSPILHRSPSTAQPGSIGSSLPASREVKPAPPLGPYKKNTTFASPARRSNRHGTEERPRNGKGRFHRPRITYYESCCFMRKEENALVGARQPCDRSIQRFTAPPIAT